MIHLDTSVLIDAFSGSRGSAPALRRAIERGERVLISTIVLYEWLRGPRLAAELAVQRALFPAASAAAFTHAEAAVAAELYRSVRRPRGREIDLAIAACAMTQRAALWTLNARDFHDVPGLSLVEAGAGG